MIDAVLLGELQQLQQLTILWAEPPFQTQANVLTTLAQAIPRQETRQAPIVLGQPESLPYIVVIPTSDPAVLERVRQFAPHPFLTQSRWGFYIQVEAFGDRTSAERLNRRLRDHGFDVRVVFLRANN